MRSSISFIRKNIHTTFNLILNIFIPANAICLKDGHIFSANNFVEGFAQHGTYALKTPCRVQARGISGNGLEDLEYIFENSPSQSALHRLVVDTFFLCVNWVEDKIVSESKRYPPEFLYELARMGVKAYNEKSKGQQLLKPWKKDLCAYYDHVGGPEEYSCTSTKNECLNFSDHALHLKSLKMMCKLFHFFSIPNTAYPIRLDPISNPLIISIVSIIRSSFQAPSSLNNSPLNNPHPPLRIPIIFRINRLL